MKDFGLVVIGAHSGAWLNDIILKYKDQKILLVEPVPYNYQILQTKYNNNENIFIDINAIYSENTKKEFFFVKESSIKMLGKHWASGIGSFDKQHILNHKNKRFNIEDSDISKIDIDFLTFDNLISKYQIQSIDFLQIDVEGAEYEILNSINFSKIKIKNIQFESKHFDGTFKEGHKLEEVKKKLKDNGYKLKQLDKENILAQK